MLRVRQSRIQFANVNGVRTRIYTKFLTGTLGANPTSYVAHGVADALNKILSIIVHVYEDTAYAAYIIDDFRMDAPVGENPSYLCCYDATNIKFSSVGEYVRENGYRIRIDYIL